jgi:N-acetylgalactosamine-N,N'-diacetylbacillosaminyl-diphospho-undecaprenol 4-alpha-N-acetylgalactosaminyltransferase
MKTAILINSFGGGGAERAASVLLQHLSTAGIAAELFCLESDRFFSPPAGTVPVQLGRTNSRTPGLLKLLMLPVLALRLKRTVRSRGIDVVQSHLFRSSYVNGLARLLGSRHRVQIVNGGQASLYRRKGLLGRVNLFLMRRLFDTAEVVVAKSSGMKRDFQSTVRPRSPVTVIHNPYDLEGIRRLAAEPVEEPAFCGGAQVVLSVGRLIMIKRQRDLLQALAVLAPDFPALRLAFLGEGPEQAGLEQLAVDLKVRERCFFLGLVRNPFKYMRRASCLASASESEGFPNVVVEALACGCPVVSSDCQSGPREILAPRTDPLRRLESGLEVAEAGILFAVGDSQALAAGVRLVIEDEALRQRLRRAGDERCQAFGMQKIGDQYVRLLEHGV